MGHLAAPLDDEPLASAGAPPNYPAPSPGRCHWPLGEPRRPGFRFCDAPTPRASGQRYCPQHQRIAYVRAREER